MSIFRRSPKHLVVDINKLGDEISPLIFGQNLEHTRHAMWHGLSAELVANRKFVGESTSRDGITNAPIKRGQMDANGVMARWYGIGKLHAKFFADPTDCFTGTQSQCIEMSSVNQFQGEKSRISINDDEIQAGIGQRNIAIEAGREYAIRMWVRTDRQMNLTVRLIDKHTKRIYFEESLSIYAIKWHEWRFKAKISITDLESALEILFEGSGKLWIGAVSMLPADHYYGMRADVIEQLKLLQIPLLRWPGGNFTADYRWQEGLLEVDKRPPIHVFSAATLPFTDNYDFHEVGIDEYIQLCRAINTEPCITINIHPEMATPEDAAAWVQYCNGSADSKWGRIRVERGQAKPYNVKYWSIGNEIFGLWMGPSHSNAAIYAQRIAQYVRAMKEADPSIKIIASGNKGKWNKIILKQAGNWIDYLSIHMYVPELRAHAAIPDLKTYTWLVRSPITWVGKFLKGVRKSIAKTPQNGKMISIAFDEWNIWHMWFILPFKFEWRVNIVDGMFAAGILNMLCRETNNYGIGMAAYFQPINEGLVAVEPFSTRLTAIGQIFILHRIHSGNRLIKTSSPKGLDICASMNPQGHQIYVSLLNTNGTKSQATELQLQGIKSSAKLNMTILTADTLGAPNFTERKKQLILDSPNQIKLTISPRSIVYLEISFE